MASSISKKFAERKVLFLQGPVGPFFWRLSEDLRWVGSQVWKINFNGGDWIFYPFRSTSYTGDLSGWETFLREFVISRGVEVVILFGDCRPVHLIARQVCESLGIEVWVFEEGYIRPDYITFEKGGVNARSSLSRNPIVYLNEEPPQSARKPESVPRTFGQVTFWAMVYYAFSHLLVFFFRRYRHHRPLVIWEGLYWLRGFWRKWWYGLLQRGELPLLTGPLKGRFFLVALQVHVDSQITVHSRFETVERFIEEVIASFAQHASSDEVLVFKHHPLDRGYHDYTATIERCATPLGVRSRVRYIHDQPLPVLLEACKGVVVINSTVGMSSIHHGRPTKVCGSAVYDMPGLTFQGTLDEFWTKAGLPGFVPDCLLYRRFRAHLLAKTQINGNFYRKLDGAVFHSGVDWSGDGLDHRSADTGRGEKLGEASDYERFNQTGGA